MSQLNDASLERLINSFTRASVCERADAAGDEEYLIEEDCDEYVDLEEDDENEETKMSSLARLFTVYLKELELERLSDLLENKSNLIMYIYAKIKYLAQKIAINNENDEAKTKLIEMLSYIELVHDRIESSESTLQFECFASFFIVTLKISYVLFDLLKQMTPLISEDELIQSQSSQSSSLRTVFISSQISTSIGLNKFNTDLSNRLNSILIKQASILEKKINKFNENKRLQLKLIYFLNKLLGDYLYEAKTMAFIWKLITKIVIKNRLFSEADDMNEIVIKSKTENTYSIKFIFNKLFYCIYKITYYHLKKFKLDLLKQNNLNEMGKLFKYTGFLFKVFKTFVVVYHSLLVDTEAFYLLTNIFSAVSMLLFQKENDLNYKKFKFEFAKEAASLTDELIDLYAQNADYLAYLNENNFSKFEKLKLDLLNKFALVYKVVDTENYYNQVDYYEELCLFYSILINRTNQSADTDPKLITTTLDNLIELASICTHACNLPLEFISFELFRYDLAKLNDLNYKSECLHIEFYDLIFINLFNYCMLNIQSCKYIFSYLINNLTLDELNRQATIRIHMCRDLLELVLKKLLNLKIVDSLKVFQFLFDAYEFSVLNTSACLAHYEECLIEVIRFYLTRFDSNCVLRLVDYLREAKHFTSFNLIMSLQLKQLSSRAASEYSVSRVIDYFVGFYSDLSTFLTQQAKQIDQNLLRKLINFIKNKNGLSIIKWVKFNLYNLNQTLVEAACKCLNAFFLKLDFVETFLKLFESFILVSTDTDSKQASQIYDNFKFVFVFIFNSIRVWSELASQSSDADKLVLLEFLQRYCGKQIDSNKSEFTLILFNFKYQTIYALARLLDKEVKENNLRKKVIDLACSLSDQSTNPILKEMLAKYLGNLASYGHVNSKIVVEMVRLNSNIREIVSHNSSELNFSEDKTLDMILIENNIQLLEEIRKKQQEKDNQNIQHSQPNMNEITFDIGAKCALDDTMNAIFDTTMDVSSSSQAFRAKFDKQFDLVEDNLNELVENYISADKPRWIKEKLNSIFKAYSEKL